MLPPLAASLRVLTRNGEGLARFDGLDRRHVAIVVTSDGRRVQVPVPDSGLVAPLLDLLRSLLVGLEGLLASSLPAPGGRTDGRGGTALGATTTEDRTDPRRVAGVF